MAGKDPSHAMQIKVSVVRVEDPKISATKTSTMTPWSTTTSQATLNEADRSSETETRVVRTNAIDPTRIASRMAPTRTKTRTTDTKVSTLLNREIIES